jgi:uncharacterized protein (TIGR02145 family)
MCLEGPVPSCPGGGVPSDAACPVFPSLSSSSEVVVSSSSEVVELSSSSVEKFAFCVYRAQKACIPGPASRCREGGELSNVCPDFNARGTECEDEFNDYEAFRERTHYCSNGWKKEYGSVTYEGQTYKTVVIGSQTWMAENLNYMPVEPDSVDIMNNPVPVGNNRCYGNGVSNAYDTESPNCEKFGRFYNWVTTMDLPIKCANLLSTADDDCAINKPNHRGICPENWHVPSGIDFSELITTVGGPEDAFFNLKAIKQWGESRNTTDKFGFSALTGYVTASGSGSGANLEGAAGMGSYLWGIWSAIDNVANSAYHFYVNSTPNSSSWLSYYTYDPKTLNYNLRCIKD